MRAEIDRDGIMSIYPETEFEIYALKKWDEGARTQRLFFNLPKEREQEAEHET